MPALTVNTDITSQSRSENLPSPPPMSPITPPQQPTEPTTSEQQQPPPPPPLSLTHSSHPAQVPIMPPPPTQPVDFESNPDVIALKSAISILQMQKQRATTHIQHLEKAREEAMKHPEEFLQDFKDGKVQVGEPPRPQAPRGDDDDDSDSDSDDEMQGGDTTKPNSDQAKAWSKLPGPQNIVRCPPVNWSQYAVVGESLEKLHAEQQKRPTQGTPAARNPDGTWEHRGGDGEQQPYRGVATPFSPFVDKVERRADGKK